MFKILYIPGLPSLSDFQNSTVSLKLLNFKIGKKVKFTYITHLMMGNEKEQGGSLKDYMITQFCVFCMGLRLNYQHHLRLFLFEMNCELFLT